MPTSTCLFPTLTSHVFPVVFLIIVSPTLTVSPLFSLTPPLSSSTPPCPLGFKTVFSAVVSYSVLSIVTLSPAFCTVIVPSTGSIDTSPWFVAGVLIVVELPFIDTEILLSLPGDITNSESKLTFPFSSTLNVASSPPGLVYCNVSFEPSGLYSKLPPIGSSTCVGPFSLIRISIDFVPVFLYSVPLESTID